MKNWGLYLMSCGLLLGSSPLALGSHAPKGQVDVSLVTEGGTLLPEMHVYVFRVKDNTLVATAQASGYASIEVPPGRYRVHAAGTRLTGDGIEHYTSPEAVLRVASRDTVSTILSLKLIEHPDYGLDEAMLKKMNIDRDVLKYLE